MGHFTVVCSAIWPLTGSEAAGDLVFKQTSLLLLCGKLSCSHSILHLNDKDGEFCICIKTRSPPGSVVFTGQVTTQTTVKWPIDGLSILKPPKIVGRGGCVMRGCSIF